MKMSAFEAFQATCLLILLVVTRRIRPLALTTSTTVLAVPSSDPANS